MVKCKNESCNKEFYQKTHDIFGRIIPEHRRSPFCSDKCRGQYFRKQHPSYYKERYRKYFKKNLNFDDLTACEQAGIADMVAEEEYFSLYGENLSRAVSDYIDRHNVRDLFDRAKSYIKDAEITEKVLNMKE